MLMETGADPGISGSPEIRDACYALLLSAASQHLAFTITAGNCRVSYTRMLGLSSLTRHSIAMRDEVRKVNHSLKPHPAKESKTGRDLLSAKSIIHNSD